MTRLDSGGRAAGFRPRLGVSFIVSLATAYIFFIALLQTTEVSPFRLGLAGAVLVTSWAGTFIAGNRWVHRRLAALPGINRSLLLCLVLPALLLPAIFRGPAFPKSPFFRPWSELAIEFTASPLNPGAVPLPTGGVKLRLGDERTLNRHQFDPNGGWSRQGKTLLLGPGSVARLDWVGVVPRSVELAIDPPAINGRLVVRWDETVTAVELDANSKAPIVLQRLFPIPWGWIL